MFGIWHNVGMKGNYHGKDQKCSWLPCICHGTSHHLYLYAQTVFIITVGGWDSQDVYLVEVVTITERREHMVKFYICKYLGTVKC